jgi:outer membrane protein OmpA-like peptidoglycan-associated protein
MISKRLSTLVFLITIFVYPSFAQQEIKELHSGYYMTVAAYLSTGEGYAIRYTDKLKSQGFSADYGFTYKKNMYFVYIKEYSDFKLAVSEIKSTRENTPFDDAWVYQYEAIKPAKEIVSKEVEQAPSDTLQVAQDTAFLEIKVQTNENEGPEPSREVDNSRIIYFEALQARTQEPVNVEVTLFDPFTEHVITTMKSWETKRVAAPDNDKNMIRVKTNTFGWKGDAVSFNFKDPVTDSTNYFVKISNDTLILFFDMHRLRKGDVQTLYNVYFQSEAAIMRPSSKLQIKELWEMMDENPNTRIKLHGHSNGNATGSYTRLGENDTKFFEKSGLHEITSGSAKNLSFDRAQTVKRYLIWRGVDEDRIEVKGWGGKKQIYDKHSRASQRNIRVEVEILE